MRRDSGVAGTGAGGVRSSSRSEEYAEWRSVLGTLDPMELDEAAALEAITALERLKRAAAAAQARLSVRVDALARARQRAEGVAADKLGAGVAAQIALARMESPHRGGRDLGLAKVLTHELPHTLASMERGDVGEWQATLVARETACVTAETRRAIDEQIAARLPRWGDAQTVREVRKLAYAAEPGAAVARHARAVSQRQVSIRPAPDTMCYLTALLPAPQGVAAYAALVHAADRARASGDQRGKGQVMADTLIERVTGQASPPDVSLEVEVVMTAESLLGDAQTPAHLVGYGPVPAAVARSLARDTAADVWLRRLFTSPESGQLVAMDSRRRCFEGQLRHFLILRDQFCRMPWCDAPIRHLDHLDPSRSGGPTSAANAQGLCEACSYAKEAPGWRATGDHVVTPTGGRYANRAPDPPGSG